MHRRSTEGFRGRALTDPERELVCWLLARGGDEAHALLPQVDHALVVGRCACGCASLDLAVEGRESPGQGEHAQVSPDFFWNEPGGGLCAVYVYAGNGALAGVDTWSVDGVATPVSLPSIAQLRPDP